MKKLEHLIESIILASRWLLVVFYLGLAVALAIYAVSFVKKLYDFVEKLFSLEETDTILKMLGLIDAIDRFEPARGAVRKDFGALAPRT